MPSLDAMSPASSAEATLYFTVAKLLGDNKDKAIKNIENEAQWAMIMRYASEAMVITELAWSLREYADLLPADIHAYLEAVLTLNQDRNRTILLWLEQIIGQLNTQKIIPLVLKGSATLLEGSYPDIGFRMQSDIDILVKPTQIRSSYESLAAIGYQFGRPEKQQHREVLVADETTSPNHWRYKAHVHLPPMINPDSPCAVEIHRHCVSRRFQKQLPLADLYEEAVLHQRQSLQYLTLSAQHQFSHAVLHDFIGSGSYASYQMPLRFAMRLSSMAAPDLRLGKQLIAKEVSDFVLKQCKPSDKHSQDFANKLLKQLNGDRWVKSIAACRHQVNALQNLLANPGKIAQKFS